MGHRKLATLVALCIAAIIACAPAHAQLLYRSYLASDGSDTHPCSMTQPCRFLPAALAAVEDGGQVWMLDSANYNVAAVDITKSVTILAVPGARGSVVAAGEGEAFRVGTAGVRFTLRNVLIVSRNPGENIKGINFFGGAAELNVTGCEITLGRYGTGIDARAADATITVRNTLIRDVSNGIHLFGTGLLLASIENVHFTNTTLGVAANISARATVSHSVFSHVGTGVYASGLVSTGMARLAVERSAMSGGGTGIVGWGNAAGQNAQIVASRNVFTVQTTGIQAAGNNGASVNVIADGNTFTQNVIGLSMQGAPAVYTRGNNTFRNNSNSDLSGGALTPFAPM